MILPQPGAGFDWRETAFGPALVCSALEPVAAHLFTTRHWPLGQSPAAAHTGWDDVAGALGGDRRQLLRLKQVHGRQVRAAADVVDTTHDLLEGDILISDDRERIIAVQAADCVPIVIADRRRGWVAAAHAGWRGLAAGVPRVAVEAMIASYGSQPGDLVAALGPSIGACCYEVGSDVREAFIAAGFAAERLARWFHQEPISIADNPRIAGGAASRPGHFYFDGWSSAREQLQAAGIEAASIYSAGLCTASHPALFPSYRRDGAAAGRIAAAIIAGPAGERRLSTRGESAVQAGASGAGGTK
jgi:YfiH family protein